MFGLMASKYVGSFTPSDYSAIATTARAIADEFIAENTASGAPMADSDNPELGAVVQSVAEGSVYNTGATSTNPTDHVALGKQIYAASKEALTKLI
jgi:hypothetical protein